MKVTDNITTKAWLISSLDGVDIYAVVIGTERDAWVQAKTSGTEFFSVHGPYEYTIAAKT